MMLLAPLALAAALLLLPAPASSQSFTRILTGPMVTDASAGRSVNWVDYDNDLYLDLFVSNGKTGGQANFLYHNEHDGTFTQVLAGPLVTDIAPSDGSSWADFDNDGDLDAVVVAWYDSSNAFFVNHGDGTFSQTLDSPIVGDRGYSETCSWGDYDNDGFLDLYVSNSGSPTLGGPRVDFLYHNDHDGTFSRVMTGPIATDAFYSRGVSWIDYDNDGDLDIFIANERGQSETLYRNMLTESGTATFVSQTGSAFATSFGSSFSASWGDVDNDGDFDVFITNGGPSQAPNNFYFNNGDGTFTRLFGDSLVRTVGFYLGSALGDVDNDGDLDLFVTTAGGNSPLKSLMYQNRLMETGTFSFKRIGAGGIVNDTGHGFGCAWGDYDVDGDLDLFIAKTYAEAESDALYRNDNSNGNHWLEVRCVGTTSNRSGIGAKLRILATIGGNPVWQLREVDGQSGYCGQNLDQHFGLGDAAVLDSVIIEWPSGQRDRYAGLAVDRLVVAQEGVRLNAVEGLGPLAPSNVALLQNVPNPFEQQTRVSFTLARAQDVTVSVVDLAGRVMHRLADGPMAAGRHELPLRASGLPNGVYFCTVRDGATAALVATRRLVVMR